MPTVTIDGVPVEVETGATILDAANKLGIWIPTLCYHPAISPPAVCRLCMVELDRGGWKQLVTSCNYPVRRDIAISVSSERAVRARQGVMKLLLARAPESKALRELAGRMGVDGTPYPIAFSADCAPRCARRCWAGRRSVSPGAGRTGLSQPPSGSRRKTASAAGRAPLSARSGRSR